MAAAETLHPRFLAALRRLAATDASPAAALRRLRPVAEKIDLPRPSYPTVRRFLLEERARRQIRNERIDRVMRPLLAGRVPRV